MTLARDLANIISGGFTASDIPANPVRDAYGFSKNASGQLIITHTNDGADNISKADHASFDDMVFAPEGITWSISGTDLIATI
jgi:hypothetical protein